MKLLKQKGLNYGFNSGIITTLGLMVGVYATTQSKIVVLSAIITIAVADALSDSFGMHLSEESQNNISHKKVWQTTLSTFVGKFIFSIIFILPLLILPLLTAIIINIILGIVLLVVYNILLAKNTKKSINVTIFEHLSLAFFVIIITYLIGLLLR